jgi:hypothetical protein
MPTEKRSIAAVNRTQLPTNLCPRESQKRSATMGM